MADTISKEYLKKTIKVPRNSAKTCSKITKTSKWHNRLCYGIPDVQPGQVPQSMQCF